MATSFMATAQQRGSAIRLSPGALPASPARPLVPASQSKPGTPADGGAVSNRQHNHHHQPYASYTYARGSAGVAPSGGTADRNVVVTSGAAGTTTFRLG